MRGKTITIFGTSSALPGSEIYELAYQLGRKLAGVALTIAKTMIIPTAVEYQNSLIANVEGIKNAGCKSKSGKELLQLVCDYTDKASAACAKLEKGLHGGDTKKIIDTMNELREAADELEGLLPDSAWPLPSYAEMLFLV